MKILHLSDTSLSGSPIRISQLINKYTDHESRHITWHKKTLYREFETDLVGSEMEQGELQHYLNWADILHFHNRWKRQIIFRDCEMPKKPSVIQIHSPRDWENFAEEEESKLPFAVIAQFHVREWPEAKFIVPNVVDIKDHWYLPWSHKDDRDIPWVSYAPSNFNAKGWNDKGYGITAPVLKRLSLAHIISYKLMISKPHLEVLKAKKQANIGIDEIVTGSYHLSSLEYLSMGIPCFGYLDEKTTRVVKDITGAEELPWIQCKSNDLKIKLSEMVHSKSYIELGKKSRKWMEKYWSPEFLSEKYVKMYEEL